MGWAAIIAELWKIFGPLVGELLKKILDNLFKKVSKNMTATGRSGEDSRSLIEAALEATKGRPLQRLVLKAMRKHVAEKGLVKMEGDERKEFKALCAAAE